MPVTFERVRDRYGLKGRIRLSRIWRASGPLRPYKFSHGRHIVGVLGKSPVYGGGIERNLDAFDGPDRNRWANALQGMSHPSILAKQDRPETDIESEDSWAPPY